jgi:hypothetical protein
MDLKEITDRLVKNVVQLLFFKHYHERSGFDHILTMRLI